MASTLKINNIDSASGTTITIPTGKTLVGTDEGAFRVPGTILQVVDVSGNTATTVTSDTIVRVGIEAAITPKASNSKIIVLCNATVRWAHGDCGFTALHRKIGSGSYSEIKQFSRHTMYRNFDTTSISGQHISFNYIDSPSTTDAVTYQWAMNRWSSGTTYFLPNPANGDTQNWTLMELAQ